MGSFFAGVLTLIFVAWVFKCSKTKPKNQPNITARISIETNEDGSTILTKMVNDRRVGMPVFLPEEASPDKIKRTAEEMAEEVRQEYPSLR